VDTVGDCQYIPGTVPAPRGYHTGAFHVTVMGHGALDRVSPDGSSDPAHTG
jgi:hypothetical protein